MLITRYFLTENSAKKLLTDAVEEVYSHRPVYFKITLSGGVDKLPMLHVEYDGHAYQIENDNGEEKRTDDVPRVIDASPAEHLVRCKDCVHHKDAPQTTDVWCEKIDGLLPEDWFCADGERRTDDGEKH